MQTIRRLLLYSRDDGGLDRSGSDKDGEEWLNYGSH